YIHRRTKIDMMKVSTIVADYERAYAYLQEVGLLKKFEKCPYCGSTKIGKIPREKVKCYQCRKDWSIQRKIIFEYMKIPLGSLSRHLNFFRIQISGLKVSKQLGISRISQKLYHFFRKVIY
ncbi:MAG: DDE transposase, partial [Bacteroidetes bacterium]